MKRCFCHPQLLCFVYEVACYRDNLSVWYWKVAQVLRFGVRRCIHEGLERILMKTLEDLEGGGIFRRILGTTNFVEGDYFSWYLEEFDEEIAEVISIIAKKLSDYEPATPILEPEYAKDLLKRLYQHLVPRKVRRDLGEFYAPDWLAELVLDEAGFTIEKFEELAEQEGDPTAPLQLRLLDPACGSGTFLVLAIKRLKEYAEEHYLKDVLGDYVLKNVIGYDLNLQNPSLHMQSREIKLKTKF